ncbi:putative sulfate exporter family transporter [Saccharopolyspora indica]|uniref:YeiH family protein n=1 Tax=Saccharopolyspora indica TaxID=1229659 RepID=UPI0022EA7DB8|nr:putative sulfate exporter family transporter [Saccharopolyspora indica]MDA3645503.1 putative sulfate exporter family transporter [Saccharopolyspora indica]
MTKTVSGARAGFAVLWPGLAVTVAAVVVSMAVAGVVPAVSALTVAVVLGVVAGNVPGFPVAARAGVAWSAKKLLRSGVVLLGLQLSVGQVLGLGAGTVVAVLLVVVVTFAGTVLLGRLLGVSRGLSLLVATGFSICGASAVAAVEGVVERDDEDVATSVAMVTVFGTVSMLGLPVLFSAWGLSAEEAGRIAGGSVHEVAQVVAAASPVGAAAVAIAVVVKLSRVVLLAPVVAVVSLLERRRSAGAGPRPPVMPLFVLGFLLAVALRSTGVLPVVVLDVAKQLTTLLLAGALFALGFSVRIRALLRNGPKAFALGACSTVLVTAVGIAAMLSLA